MIGVGVMHMVLVHNWCSCNWLVYCMGLGLGAIWQIGGPVQVRIGILCMWYECLIRFQEDWQISVELGVVLP